MPNNDDFDLTQGNENRNPIITSVDQQQPIVSANNNGLTAEEERDPNKIIVNISDPSPIVILFGAGNSGKTMTLIRLTRYLKKQGYKVEPDRIFRPSNSKLYQDMCDTFDNTVNSDYAAASTQTLSFMLVKVMNKYGEPICQILEAPGEHYFSEKDTKKGFPTYINKIGELDNRKTWVFIVEKDWKDSDIRKAYADKIVSMQSQDAVVNDKIIFTCHKADLHKALFDGGVPNRAQFFKDINNQYPNIFSKYLNKNPITSWFRKYNFDFIVFSAGRFNKTEDGGQVYNQSNDRFAADLWKAIHKTIKGSWNLF